MNNNEEIRKQNIVEMPDFDSFIPTPVPMQNSAAQDIPQNTVSQVSNDQLSDQAVDMQAMQDMFRQMMAYSQNGSDGGSDGNSGTAAALAAAEKNMKRKSITLMASIFLLVALLIIGSIAWYTRISGVTGMSLQAAKFDFKANYVKDNVIIDVWDYWGVNNQKAAPGTGGVIPILLSSDGTSETGVNYSVNLNFADMADKFKQRLRYFYFTNDNVLHPIQPAISSEKSEGVSGQLMAASQQGSPNAEKFEYIYWEWIYEFSDDWFLWNDYWYHGNTTYNIEQIANSFENADEKAEVKANLLCASGGQPTITGKTIFEVAFPTPEKFFRNGVQYSNSSSINVSTLLPRDKEVIGKILNKGTISGSEYFNLLYPSSSSFSTVPLTSYKTVKSNAPIGKVGGTSELSKAQYLNEADFEKVGSASSSTMTANQYFDYLYPYGQMTLSSQQSAFDSFDTNVGLGSYNTEVTLLRNGIPYCYYAGDQDRDGDGRADKLVEDPNDPAKTVSITAYQKAMTVKLSITGAQARPILFQVTDDSNTYLDHYGVKMRDQKYARGTTKYLKESEVGAFSGASVNVDSTIGKHTGEVNNNALQLSD